MSKIYYVYRHLFPDGRAYIGVTTNPKRRWEAHGCNYKEHTIFWDAVTEIGWDNIKHLIVSKYDNKERAREKEKKLAEYYQYYGLSLNAGNGHSHSPSTKNRLSVSKAMKTRTVSTETRRKIGEAIKKRVGTKYFRHRLN